MRRLRAVVSRRLHPALRENVRRLLPKPPRRAALVTIVIPVFDVESYLAECLSSVIRQTYRELQILVVDDGSRDGSLAIARSYARWDRRISVVHQENRGLGAARNAGVARARGTYLCFVDSDDVLPLDAISRMVTAILRSSSDFVVGALTRLSDQGQTVPSWVTRVHASDRWGLRLAEFPDVLTNVFAWNKLFERSFFDRVIGTFPEGVLYEDQEPIALAYANGTFDVIKACTYHWRVRSDGSSITQQKDEVQNLADRLLVLSRVLPVMAGAGGDVLRTWLAKTLALDLRPYLAVVHRVDVSYWHRLRSAVTELADLLDPDLLGSLPFVDRYCTLALLADRRDAVIGILTRQDEYGSCLPGVVVDGAVTVDSEYLAGLGFTPESSMLRLSPADLGVVAKVSSWEWAGDQLHLGGSAFVGNLPTEPRSVSLQAVAPDGTVVDLPTVTRHDVQIDAESSNAWNSHAWGAFTTVVDTGRLSTNTTWRLVVDVSYGHLSWSGELGRDFRGAAAEVPIAPPDDRGRWMVEKAGTGLRLRYRAAAWTTVDIIEITDSAVTIRVDDPGVRTVMAVDGLGRSAVEATRDPTGRPGRLVLRLPDRPAPSRQRSEDYRLLAVTTLGRTTRVCAAARCRPLERSQLSAVTEAPDGSLGLRRWSWSAAVHDVDLHDGTIVIRGRIALRGAVRVAAVLAADREEHRADAFDLDRDGGLFTARFAADGLSRRRGFVFRLRLTWHGEVIDLWVPVDQGLCRRFPLDAQAGASAATFTRTVRAGALWVRLRHPYTLDERGALAQHHLHRRHQRAGGEADRPAVLFDVFSGSAVSDSPRAIFEVLRDRDLGFELFWAVEDVSMEIPDGARPLLLSSRRWYEVLSEARFLVNNQHFPFYFRKRPGQTYVQTWHGTPLKRLGNDIASPRQSRPYLALMRREATYWDFLLAQNDFAAERLPSALGYVGPVINEGYPRNDVLTGDRAVARRTAARNKLGLRGRTILYAPTWRDRETDGGQYAFIDHLDHGELRRRFGDSVTVLVRGHANTRHARRPDAVEHVIDVTQHPDVNELILAADVLVTDYSSLMFDFCVTGKPMIFLTPDLATYRDQVRGFYLDFEHIAPGPFCQTTTQLAHHLDELGVIRTTYADRYDSFRRRFAPRDDGAAGERVVDRVWGSSRSRRATA